MAKNGQSDHWRQWVLNSLPTPRMEATEPVTSLAAAPTSVGTAEMPFSGPLQLQPTFDVIELLPPAAQERLRKLRQRSADAHRLIPEFETVREASMAKVEAENALKRLISHPQDGGFRLPEDDRRVIVATKAVENATDDLRRLQERSETRAQTWRAASGALAAVEDWLRHGKPGNCKLEVVEVEPSKLNKGENIHDAIDRLRRRGRELKADLHRIESAPYPSGYAKQRMREQIAQLAQRGAPSVARLVELDGPVDREIAVGGLQRATGCARVPRSCRCRRTSRISDARNFDQASRCSDRHRSR
jgi:hypothetical protein